MMPGPTVLVVDDDPVILDLLAVNFELEGYTVLRASDGEEALAVTRLHRPDVVVTDIMMPKRSGLEVVAELKGDPATAAIPVVLVSAKALASDVRAGREAGADDYVTKPFDPDDLLKRVDRLVGR
jgi:CheY-like chemotaxis protein